MTTHKHGTERHRKVAEDNLIWLVRTGSAMYGTQLEDSDIDLTGVCVEPPEVALGMLTGQPFQQYQNHVPGEKIQPGAEDKTVFSLRKFAYLCASGDPNLTPMLFTPTSEVRTEWSDDLQRCREVFISKYTGYRFFGYAKSIAAEQVVKDTMRRSELIDKYGFDTKAAYHMLRVAHTGTQLMTTGEITLPMKLAGHLVDVRLGMYSRDDVLSEFHHQMDLLDGAINSSDLPYQPDYTKINEWVARLHLLYWQFNDLHADPVAHLMAQAELHHAYADVPTMMKGTHP